MESFQTIIGIDVAQNSLAVSIFDGRTHHIEDIEYTKRNIKKVLIVYWKCAKKFDGLENRLNY